MSKVRLVKCHLLKNGSAPRVEDVRYVPLSEFKLWEYYMCHKYGWKVLVTETSYWCDEEEPSLDSYTKTTERLERVHRIVVEWLDENNVIVPQERFFPEELYDMRKDQFLKHYPTHRNVNGVSMVTRRVEESTGFFVRSRRVGSDSKPEGATGPGGRLASA